MYKQFRSTSELISKCASKEHSFHYLHTNSLKAQVSLSASAVTESTHFHYVHTYSLIAPVSSSASAVKRNTSSNILRKTVKWHKWAYQQVHLLQQEFLLSCFKRNGAVSSNSIRGHSFCKLVVLRYHKKWKHTSFIKKFFKEELGGMKKERRKAPSHHPNLNSA